MLLIPEPRKVTPLKGTCPIDVVPEIRVGNANIHLQGYCLTIKPDAIVIDARDPAGAFYGEQTVRQIKEQSNGADLKCIRVDDWPDFPNRGYMLDISRDRVPTMDHLKRLVDALAALRYNQLQLYTEHTFAYAGHEVVWGTSAPMTAEEIEHLDTYCQDRFIELVPNQNSFGHMERWLKHPDYHDLAECPQGFEHPVSGRRPSGSVLAPSEHSLKFLSELYGELLPHFSSKRVNIGGDEPWELGQGWSAPLVEAEGKHAVYARFLGRIGNLALEHGAEPMAWADVILEHPESINELPSSITPIIWGYEANHPFDRQCEIIADTDRPFYVAPGDSTWNSFTGRCRNMLENVRSAARHALHHKASGIIMTHWGDNGHQQTWPTALPGMVACGLFAWHGDAETNLDLTAQINRLFFKDETEIAASVLMEIADVDRAVPVKATNASFLSASTRMTPAEISKKIADCPTGVWQDLVSQTWDWEASLAKAQLEAPDATWLIDELELAIGLTRFAAQRCQAIAEAPADQPFELNPSLRADLNYLIGEFETSWVHRSRVGGLHESSTRLRAMLG